MLAPIVLSLVPLGLLGLTFWGLWPQLRDKSGLGGVGVLLLLTLFVSVPSLVAAVSAAL